MSGNVDCTPVTTTKHQQVASLKIEKGVKNRNEYEDFLHKAEKVHAEQERENGKVSLLPKPYENEDSFVRELCRGIALDVITHCVRKSITAECEEECERGVKNDNGR